MPLKDLIITERAVTEDLIEKILAGHAGLATDTRRAVLTPEGKKLTARRRILVVLASRHAWRFVASESDEDLCLSIKDIGEQTGLPGNTVRPALKDLKDSGLIDTPRDGVYRLPPHSLSEVATEFDSIRVSRAK